MTVPGIKTEKSTCPRCHATFPSSSLEGLCSRCLALLVTDAPSTSPNRPEHFGHQRFFGDYEILDELGRGGSGIVFKARQLGVNRIVALKLLCNGPAAGRDFVHRFHTEAAAAAALEHPNIVPVYEFGEHEGAHFLAMRYLEGGTLQGLIARGRPNPRDAARLLRTIAAAVEHAHRRGILHRDLKPGNILLSPSLPAVPSLGGGVSSPASFLDEPFVTDFGLARILEHESSLTLTHSVLGTVAYLAPEVASGGAAFATTASDIYALGAILYELITGRPPFVAPTIAATLGAIVDEIPVFPSKSTVENKESEIPLDLETICLKCLEKDPSKRYPTAQSLADDLQRFLNREPISARPISRGAKLVRWSQRNPALATSYALLLFFAGVILIASPLAVYRINQSRQAEFVHRKTAESEALRARQNEYVSDMLLAQERLSHNDRGGVVRILQKYRPSGSELDLRNWEWHYLSASTQSQELAVLRGHSSRVTDVAYSPDGRWIASAGLDQIINIWDARSHARVRRLALADVTTPAEIYSIAFSPDGKFLVAGADQSSELIFWEAPEWKLSKILANEYRTDALSFSPDGRFLAVCGQRGGNGVVVWDAAIFKPIASWPLPETRGEFPVALAFSHDSKTLVFDSKDGDLGRWSAENRQKIAPIRLGNLNDTVDRALFTPDGLLAAAGTAAGVLRVWSLPEWHQVYQLTNRFLLALSITNDLLVTTDSQALQYYRLRTGEHIGTFKGHEENIWAAAISPNGQTVASASSDTTVRLWPASPQPFKGLHLTLRTNNQEFSTAVRPYLSADGRLAFSLSTNGSFSIWDTERFTLMSSHPSPLSDPQEVQVCPGGKIAAVGGLESGLALIDLASDRVIRRAFITNSVYFVRFSPDGSRVAVAFGNPVRLGWLGHTHHLQIFETDGLKLIRELPLNGGSPFGGAFSGDNRHFAYSMWSSLSTVSDLETGQSIELRGQQGRIFNLAMTPDARLIATTSTDGDGTVTLWDGRTSNRIQGFRGACEEYSSVALLEDGTRLAGGGLGIDVWDLATRRLVQTIPATNTIFDLAWTSHDQRLTAIGMGSLHAWNAESYSSTARAPQAIATILQAADDRNTEALRLLHDLSIEELARRVNEQPGLPNHFWRRMGVMARLWEGDLKGAMEEDLRFTIPDRDPRCTPRHLDLSRYYNRLLVRDGFGDGADLSDLPSGLISLGSVEFDVRAIVQLGCNNPKLRSCPAEVKEISVGQRARQLHFLHAIGFQAPEGSRVGRYLLHYENGSSAELPLRYGDDSREWWTVPGEPANTQNAKAVWRGNCPAAKAFGQSTQLWKRTYDNPRPELKIRSFDFISAMGPASPMLVALTLE